jgi:hypothetical protein
MDFGFRGSRSRDFSRFSTAGCARRVSERWCAWSRSKKQQIPHCASRHVRSEANVPACSVRNDSQKFVTRLMIWARLVLTKLGIGEMSGERGIFVEEEGDDRAEGGSEEEEAGDGEEHAGGLGYEAVDSGDASAGVGEDEAEEGEADPSGDVEAAARGGDGQNDHDREAGECERDDKFEIETVGIGGEKSEQGDGCGC